MTFILLGVCIACQKQPSAQYEHLYSAIDTLHHVEDLPVNNQKKSGMSIPDSKYIVELNYTNKANNKGTLVTLAVVQDAYIKQIKMTNNMWICMNENSGSKINLSTRECMIEGIEDFNNCTVKVLHEATVQ